MSKGRRHKDAVKCIEGVIAMMESGKLELGGVNANKLSLMTVTYHNLAVERVLMNQVCVVTCVVHCTHYVRGVCTPDSRGRGSESNVSQACKAVLVRVCGVRGQHEGHTRGGAASAHADGPSEGGD